MSLNDREQQILSEIERQFYAEDPDLAYTAKNLDRIGRFGVRLPAVGMVAGLALIGSFFAVNRFLAAVGFCLLVASTTGLVHGLRSRGGRRTADSEGEHPDRRSPSGRRRRWR